MIVASSRYKTLLVTQLQRIAIASTQLQSHQLTLTQEQSHYLGRVLRLREGDRFIAMDGQGQWWLAELESLLDAKILNAIDVQTELPIAITLLIAMPKGNGMDEIVRQVTELGVTRIVPVISDRTLLNPSPSKVDRWRRIAQEAAEQSERQIVPEIADPLGWKEAIQIWNGSNAIAYLCEARGNYPHLLPSLTNVFSSNKVTSVAVPTPFTDGSSNPQSPLAQRSEGTPNLQSPIPLIIATGAEGGWTEEEIKAAIAANYQPISLGRRVLRAVTAPIMALSIVASVIEAMLEGNNQFNMSD